MPERHYSDFIMTTIASQITSLMIVYSTVYSGADQSKHQSSASLAFVWGIHRGPVNSPHKWPVTRKMFPFDDVIMWLNGFKPWWRHEMETLSTLLTLGKDIPPITDVFPSEGAVTLGIHVVFDVAWTNKWTNCWGAGDLGHYDGHVTSLASFMSNVFGIMVASAYQCMWWLLWDIRARWIARLKNLRINPVIIYVCSSKRLYRSRSMVLSIDREIHQMTETGVSLLVQDIHLKA